MRYPGRINMKQETKNEHNKTMFLGIIFIKFRTDMKIINNITIVSIFSIVLDFIVSYLT